ncbi:MAG: hypothetical protein AAGB04_23335 [Pseudomonadota bacterium]
MDARGRGRIRRRHVLDRTFLVRQAGPVGRNERHQERQFMFRRNTIRLFRLSKSFGPYEVMAAPHSLTCARSAQHLACHSGDLHQTAIIPSTTKALWNMRFTPQQSFVELAILSEKLLEDSSDPTIRVPASAVAALKTKAKLGSVSMPYDWPAASLAQAVIDFLATTTGPAPIVGAAVPNAQIVELGLPENGGHTASRDRGGMHQIDECCSVSDLVKLSKSYGRILKRMVSRT